jgi:hypothetical protein
MWTGRRDRRGIPVYVYEVKHLNAKTMAAYEKSATNTRSKAEIGGDVPAQLIRLFALYENLTRFVMPLCTALTDREHPRTPITQSNNIVDISGVGLKQFWNLRSHMQDASTLATARYPETLDRIFVRTLKSFRMKQRANISQIIGAPAFFNVVWGWIKKWFDPITTSKIFILSPGDMKTTLESFIDPANIPKKYGGQLDFEFGDFPSLDPALQNVVQWEAGKDNFPHGPIYWNDETPGLKWEDGKGGEKMKAIAVGSIGEKQRNEEICILTRHLEPIAEGSNGNAEAGGIKATRPELLSVPTATNSVNDVSGVSLVPEPTTKPVAEPKPTKYTSGVKLELNDQEKASTQEGKLVPASRPDPVNFVTASEGIQTLSLSEKAGDLANGTDSPHQTVTATKLDLDLEAKETLQQTNGAAIGYGTTQRVGA